MDQEKEVNQEKKVYQKPSITKVELISEEAVLGSCKEGNSGIGCGTLLTCNLGQGS